MQQVTCFQTPIFIRPFSEQKNENNSRAVKSTNSRKLLDNRPMIYDDLISWNVCAWCQFYFLTANDCGQDDWYLKLSEAWQGSINVAQTACTCPKTESIGRTSSGYKLTLPGLLSVITGAWNTQKCVNISILYALFLASTDGFHRQVASKARIFQPNQSYHWKQCS
jgi:hypothetical protein